MAALIDRNVVVDIEATCSEREAPPSEKSDIIEIGVVLLDVRTLKLETARQILVKPTRSTVSAFCTRLTGLTQEEVATGIALPEACAILRKEYESDKRLWASYGDYDRRMFERCCAELSVSYPFGPGHLNVKTLFAVVLGLPCEVNLETATGRLGLDFIGRTHCGRDYAFDIGRLVAVLMERGRRHSAWAGRGQ
jgi:inhibitor of KinA sporulation pathway (predicted exonuclease)